jgi:hypothetical protein
VLKREKNIGGKFTNKKVIEHTDGRRSGGRSYEKKNKTIIKLSHNKFIKMALKMIIKYLSKFLGIFEIEIKIIVRKSHLLLLWWL